MHYIIIALCNIIFWFSDVTKVNGELLMWVQWQNGNCKWVNAAMASTAWPECVIQFYEDRVSFDAVEHV